MLKLSRTVVIGLAGLLFAVLPAAAKPKETSVQAATIENTGSTNTTGYTIKVVSNGTVSLVVNANSVKLKPALLSKSQVANFFRDLAAAMPLKELPVHFGMRSASFGSRTFIMYKGQTTPDLTFAADAKTQALKTDVEAITKALHVTNAPRRPIPPLPANVRTP